MASYKLPPLNINTKASRFMQYILNEQSLLHQDILNNLTNTEFILLTFMWKLLKQILWWFYFPSQIHTQKDSVLVRFIAFQVLRGWKRNWGWRDNKTLVRSCPKIKMNKIWGMWVWQKICRVFQLKYILYQICMGWGLKYKYGRDRAKKYGKGSLLE